MANIIPDGNKRQDFSGLYSLGVKTVNLDVDSDVPHNPSDTGTPFRQCCDDGNSGGGTGCCNTSLALTFDGESIATSVGQNGGVTVVDSITVSSADATNILTVGTDNGITLVCASVLGCINVNPASISGDGTVGNPFDASCQLTFNAGTTAAIADNSNGQEIVNCGDTVHFWSSEQSIEFNVSAGSAVVEADVNLAPGQGGIANALQKINGQGLYVPTVTGGSGGLVKTQGTTGTSNPWAIVHDNSGVSPPVFTDNNDGTGTLVSNGNIIVSVEVRALASATTNYLLTYDTDCRPVGFANESTNGAQRFTSSILNTVAKTYLLTNLIAPPQLLDIKWEF